MTIPVFPEGCRDFIEIRPDFDLPTLDTMQIVHVSGPDFVEVRPSFDLASALGIDAETLAAFLRARVSPASGET